MNHNDELKKNPAKLIILAVVGFMLDVAIIYVFWQNILTYLIPQIPKLPSVIAALAVTLFIQHIKSDGPDESRSLEQTAIQQCTNSSIVLIALMCLSSIM